MAPDPDGYRKESKDQSSCERKNKWNKENNGEVYKGLCMNCAKSCTCLFPKSEGGVWHCTEYVESS